MACEAGCRALLVQVLAAAIRLEIAATTGKPEVQIYSSFNISGATNTGMVTVRTPQAAEVVATLPKIGGPDGVVSAEGCQGFGPF